MFSQPEIRSLASSRMLFKEKENEKKTILENEVLKYKNDLDNTTSGKKYYEAKKKLHKFIHFIFYLRHNDIATKCIFKAK